MAAQSFLLVSEPRLYFCTFQRTGAGFFSDYLNFPRILIVLQSLLTSLASMFYSFSVNPN